MKLFGYFAEHVIIITLLGALYGIILSIFGVIWLLYNQDVTWNNILPLIVNVILYFMILNGVIGICVFIINMNKTSHVVSTVDKDIIDDFSENNNDYKNSNRVIFHILLLSLFSSSIMKFSIFNNFVYIWNWTLPSFLEAINLNYSWLNLSLNFGSWGLIFGILLIIFIIIFEASWQRKDLQSLVEYHAKKV